MDKITENANNLAKELITTADAQSYIQVVNPTTGKVDNMKIADLASVVAAVLGNPLGTKGEYIGDANDLLTNGIYACESAVQNVPLPTGYLISMLTGRASEKCLQIFIGVKNEGMYVRTNTIGKWYAWRQISLV